MPDSSGLLLAALIFVVAILYSSVGHGGGSGYLAVMGLMGLESLAMKSTSLSLNILVATIGTIQFARAGCFSWRLFWPVALTSVPMAFVGGRIILPGEYYKPLIGLMLAYAAGRMVAGAAKPAKAPAQPPNLPCALLAGAVIGLVSGLSGTGGGIFLSPLILLLNWGDIRQAAGVSAPFILVNSIAGLVGLATKGVAFPPGIAVLAIAAVVGGLIGSHLGSRKFGGATLRRMLAVVLVIAALKMLFVQ